MWNILNSFKHSVEPHKRRYSISSPIFVVLIVEPHLILNVLSWHSWLLGLQPSPEKAARTGHLRSPKVICFITVSAFLNFAAVFHDSYLAADLAPWSKHEANLNILPSDWGYHIRKVKEECLSGEDLRQVFWPVRLSLWVQVWALCWADFWVDC